MLNALSNAVSGIHSSVARATQAAGNIVNASSTGAGLDGNLIAVKQSGTDVAANAVVIKAVQKDNKALLDITV